MKKASAAKTTKKKAAPKKTTRAARPRKSAASAFAPSGNERQDMLELHNRVRREMGLAEFSLSPVLNDTAQAQANYLASVPLNELLKMGMRAHDGPDGAKPYDRVTRAGYATRFVAENWAFFPDAASAFDWWMKDQWHKPQIVSPNYTDIGAGIAPHPAGNTVFVVDFAKPA